MLSVDICFKVRQLNFNIKNLGTKYTVEDMVKFLPMDTIVDLKSRLFDTKLHHVYCYVLYSRLSSDCSYYKNLVIRDVGLDRNYERPNEIILIVYN